MSDLLLDTSALSAAMAGSSALDAYLGRLPVGSELYTSVISEGEIRFGLARLPEGRRRRALSAAFERVLDDLRAVLSTTRAVASQYGILKAKLWKVGRPIGENDLWVAATGLAHGLTVLAEDPDFRQIPDLLVQSWS